MYSYLQGPLMQTFDVSLLLAETICCPNSRSTNDLRRLGVQVTSLYSTGPIPSMFWYLSQVNIPQNHHMMLPWWRRSKHNDLNENIQHNIPHQLQPFGLNRLAVKILTDVAWALCRSPGRINTTWMPHAWHALANHAPWSRVVTVHHVHPGNDVLADLFCVL